MVINLICEIVKLGYVVVGFIFCCGIVLNVVCVVFKWVDENGDLVLDDMY